MCLFHSGDGHVEGGAACVQNVASSCQEDACAVDSKRVALTDVTLQAVERAILGNLQMKRTTVSNFACVSVKVTWVWHVEGSMQQLTLSCQTTCCTATDTRNSRDFVNVNKADAASVIRRILKKQCGMSDSPAEAL